MVSLLPLEAWCRRNTGAGRRVCRSLCCGVLALMLCSGRGCGAPVRAEEVWRVQILGDSAPLSYRNDQGELSGFNVDLAETICTRLRIQCRFSSGVFNEIFDAVSSGQIELGFGNFLRTAEREQRVLFSDPIWRSVSAFVIREEMENGEDDVRSLADGQRVAAVTGSAQARYVRQQLPAATLVEYSTARVCIEAIRRQEADVALVPMMNALTLLHLAGHDRLSLGPLVTHPGLEGSVHIAFPKNRSDIKVRVDAVIADLVADGTHKRLSRRYFPFDIY